MAAGDEAYWAEEDEGEDEFDWENYKAALLSTIKLRLIDTRNENVQAAFCLWKKHLDQKKIVPLTHGLLD